MQNNSYKDTLDWLFKQFPAYFKVGASALKPTLDNCRILSEKIGNPEKDLKFIHIAGSNGKGSTSSMLASILSEAGYNVGLFTSPHILDFRERIRINGDMISEDEVIEFCNKIKDLNLDIQPSFFEITWMMALDFFQKNNTDICVIETGLGGRLDATNIIHPIISIITNISLEHTNFLGNTLNEIAFEKAGIIKENVPVLIGEYLPETKPVFEKKANEMNAFISFVEDELIEHNYQVPLLGEYQKKNFNLVLSTLSKIAKQYPITEESIQNGLNHLFINTGFKARLELKSENPDVIYDVSHNVDGIEKTLSFINGLRLKKGGDLKIVYGTSSDKDLDSIMKFMPVNATYFLTEFSSERCMKMERLSTYFKDRNLNFSCFFNPENALESAKENAKQNDVVLVFGSFFLISDIY